jgi:hypothetical protein
MSQMWASETYEEWAGSAPMPFQSRLRVIGLNEDTVQRATILTSILVCVAAGSGCGDGGGGRSTRAVATSRLDQLTIAEIRAELFARAKAAIVAAPSSQPTTAPADLLRTSRERTAADRWEAILNLTRDSFAEATEGVVNERDLAAMARRDAETAAVLGRLQDELVISGHATAVTLEGAGTATPLAPADRLAELATTEVEDRLTSAPARPRADLEDVQVRELLESMWEKVQQVGGDDDRRPVDVSLIPGAPVSNSPTGQPISIEPAALPRAAEAASVVCIFPAGNLSPPLNGQIELRTRPLHARLTGIKLCTREPFYHSPSGGHATGVLVSTDVVATAAHNFFGPRGIPLATARFVFGFRFLPDGVNAVSSVPESDVFGGALLARSPPGSLEDWVLIKLVPLSAQQAAPAQAPARFGRDSSVAGPSLETRLHMIGHPSGLPAVYSGNAKVISNRTSERIF